MKIDGVNVIADKDFSADELKYYVEVAKSKSPKMKVTDLEIRLSEDGGVDLNYRREGQKFERIRRITGRRKG